MRFTWGSCFGGPCTGPISSLLRVCGMVLDGNEDKVLVEEKHASYDADTKEDESRALQ